MSSIRNDPAGQFWYSHEYHFYPLYSIPNSLEKFNTTLLSRADQPCKNYTAINTPKKLIENIGVSDKDIMPLHPRLVNTVISDLGGSFFHLLVNLNNWQPVLTEMAQLVQ